MMRRRRRRVVFLRIRIVEVDVCFFKGEENTQPIGSWLRVFYSIHITIAHFSRKGGMTFK